MKCTILAAFFAATVMAAPKPQIGASEGEYRFIDGTGIGTQSGTNGREFCTRIRVRIPTR